MSAYRSTGRPAPRGRRIAVGVVAAALVAVGVVLLIARAAGFSEVREELSGASTAWFPLCLLAEIAALAGYAGVHREGFRWRGGPDPGAGLSAHVMLASIGATRVVVAGGAGALAATYWCFRRARFPTREALVRVLGLNTLFYVLFGIGAWTAALLLALGVGDDAPAAMTAPWLVAVPCCFLAAWIVTGPDRLARFTRPGGSVVRRALAYAIAGTGWVREVLPHPGGRRALGWSALYWVGNLVCLWAALRSVGVTLALPALVLAYATGHIATILPLPLGGAGGVDAALTYTLTVFGVALAPALVAVAVFRLFSFWAPTIPAIAALLLLPRAGRRLERLAPAGP
ncbi:MAG: YbhN family protein [Gaiellaceae bacterium]